VMPIYDWLLGEVSDWKWVNFNKNVAFL
jgi:hypothetical protein